MAAREIRESYDGGSVVVSSAPLRPFDKATPGAVHVLATERGMGTAGLRLTRTEALDLAAFLLLAIQDLDAAALTQDTPPPAPPVAEGGATTTGPSTPPAEPGRPICEHGYRFENALCPVSACGASAYSQTATTTFSPIGGSAVNR